MSLSLGTARTSWLWALPSQLWHAAVDARKRMQRAAALRRELDCMDARMLSDIGVSRAQLEFDADESFLVLFSKKEPLARSTGFRRVK